MKPQVMRLVGLAAVLGIAVLSTGCLVKETTATLCLEPDGSVRWTVLERNIHATGNTPADRQGEEDEFMAAVRAEQHPAAVAFRVLGASEVRTQVVSGQWPYAVASEARFADIGRVCQQIIDSVGEVRGQSALERNGGRTTWKIALDYDPDVEQTDSGDASDALLSLLGDDSPALFMRHGQFVEAVGFDITDDGRVAKFSSLTDHDWDKEPHLVLSLTWVAAEAATPQKK